MAPRKTLTEGNLDPIETMEQESVEETAPVVEKTPEQLKADQDAWLNEKIPFFAFRDNGQYKDDIVCWVNDEYCKIQRGKNVMIKRKFYLALEASARQKQAAAEVEEGFEDQFETDVKRFIV